MLNDAELIKRVRDGDAEAYTPLVERYRNLVYALAYHHLQNFEDARDATQDVFVRAYLHLNQVREPDKFASWLRQMTVNECRMWRRRQRPTIDLSSQPEFVSAEDGHIASIETRLSVRQAMACLSSDSRLTLTLFYMNEYSLREIAAFLEVPVTTVKSRLRDARTRLRQEMMDMVQDSIKQQPLPDDFATLLGQLIKAGREKDAARTNELMSHPQHGPALLQELMRLGHFQRFTARARRAMMYGQEEATKSNSPCVETEHLLIGLLRQPDTGATLILNQCGVTEAVVRTAIFSVANIVVGAPSNVSGVEPKPSKQCERILEVAAGEAKQVGEELDISADIGTEHLLLALISSVNTVAADTLRHLDVDFQHLRCKVREHLQSTRDKLSPSTQ